FLQLSENLKDSKKPIKKYSILGSVFFIIGLVGLFPIFVLFKFGIFDELLLSKYNNKNYTIQSIDGKILGNIRTTIFSCSETEKCVEAKYAIILNENLPKNTKEQNYYYTANIYNDIDKNNLQINADLKEVKGELLENKFEITIKKTLRIHKNKNFPESMYPVDSFFRFNRMDIYDGFYDSSDQEDLGKKNKSYDLMIRSSE
ncbi:MAG: hypothetical protein PHP62_03930, partial [Candidatus Moranbacteria bacterium]|nr:hypothetical protein [Candidatus Moranbacteria bacterium]